MTYKHGENELEGKHKRAKERLRYLNAAVEQSSEGMAAADLEGRLLFVNHAFAAAHGYSPEDLTGKHLSIFHNSDQLASVEAANRQLRDTGEFIGEIRHVRRDGSVFPAIMHNTLLRDDAGNPIAMLGTLRDITESKKAEERLRASEKLYRSLFENMLNGFAYCTMEFDENSEPVDFTYLSVNAAFERLTGLKNVIGKKVTEVIPGIRHSDPELFKIYGRVSRTGAPERFESFIKSLNMWFDVSVYSPEKGYFVAVFDVITARKRAEQEQAVMLEVLQLINEAEDWEALLKSVIHYLKGWSGCEAVGIRLRQGPDFPYFVTSGFPEEFIRLENRLCSYDENGDAKRDVNGNPILDCMCGNILCGRFDPSKSFFTTDGSFWSNCTTELLATTTDADRQARTRNRCNAVGYESVALIPLRSGRETFGLLQFNDKKKGCFTPELIALYRKIADHIANFMARKQAESRIARLNEVLRAIRKVNQLITREKDRERLVRESCAILASTGGISSAWITLFDKSGKPQIIAESGMGEIFSDFKKMVNSGGLPRCALTASERPEVVIIRDVFVECHGCGMAPLCKGKGAFCVRLQKHGKLFGFLSVSVPPTFTDDSEQQSLFRETADDIAFALYNIELEGNRIRVEKELKDSEARYRTLFEGAAEGIVIIENRTRRFKYANPSLCGMLGYSENELRGMTAKDIHRDEVLKYALSEIEAHRREGRPVTQHDIEFIRKDGTTLYADVVTTPDILIDGESCGIAFFIDTTKRMTAEDEKKKLEAQLWQAQKMEAVGRLTGGIAHDFNNLLTVIIGNTEMALMRAEKDDLIKGYLDAVKAAGGKAAALTRQLLAFSRRQVFQTEVFSLNEVVCDMEKILRRLIGEDINLKMHLCPDGCMVETDRGQVEQIIMNLAVNARDAMPGGGMLTIEAGEVEIGEGDSHSHIIMNPGRYSRMVVSDTGEGMTEEIQARIFEPFFTTKEEGKGTGLGLSIVYGIVKQSNGYIWVYSEPGKGTTFKIYFPRADKPAMVPEKTAGEPEELMSGWETLLIVEDDRLIRNLIYNVLSKSGYRVLCAADSREAIKISEGHGAEIALMITDVVMPGMGGRELANLLIEKRPGMKVLYMSGYTDNAIVNHRILEKGLFFIQKPFTSSGLRKKVREVLDGAS